MSFPPQGAASQADVSAIKAKVDSMDTTVGATYTKTSNILDIADVQLPRVQPFMDFWSDQAGKITIAGAAGDLVFPSVVVAGLPGGVTISRVIAVLKVKAIKDTSGSDNYIDQAGKTIRVIKSGASWGTDDLVAVNFDQNQWYTTASTKEGGDVMIGDNDVKGEVDGAATYNFVSAQTALYGSRADAISALADSLELYDVQMGLRVYFRV